MHEWTRTWMSRECRVQRSATHLDSLYPEFGAASLYLSPSWNFYSHFLATIVISNFVLWLLGAVKLFFFFQTEFYLPAEHKLRPPWAKLMSWEFTSDILVFHILTPLQGLPVLNTPWGLQVVVFYTFLCLRVYSCHCASVGQIGTLTHTGSGNPYFSHWNEQCKWSHLRDGKMRPGKETRSQCVSRRAISYDIKKRGLRFFRVESYNRLACMQSLFSLLLIGDNISI